MSGALSSLGLFFFVESALIIDLKDFPIEVEDPNAIWISRGLDFGSFGIDPATYYL